jgi:hypothetical protein
MSVCRHFSQRATCPPRAAVRQLSMADMTLNCPRLTWPALARRQAGPWVRKISATSSGGRGTEAARYAGGRILATICSSGLVTSPSALRATRV